MDNIFKLYLTALSKQSLADKTEATNRGDLQDLLESIASTEIKIIHEKSRANSQISIFGTPDFTVKKGALIIGYVENKRIGEDLEKTIKSDQIKKYQQLNDNILITNYCDWVLLTKSENKTENIVRASLCTPDDLHQKGFRVSDKNRQAVASLLQQFFSTAPAKISRASELAYELAMRGKILRGLLQTELNRQQIEAQHSKLYGLYGAFKQEISSALKIEEFADAFAQTLAYGLFMAKLNAGETTDIDLYNAKQHIANNFALIQEMVSFLDELDKPEYQEAKWVIDEILAMMNRLDLHEIERDLADTTVRKPQKGDSEETIEAKKYFYHDPYIYFYEDFLKAWDASTRKARGVYYTPPPAVNFIIRAVDDILQTEFAIGQGLADKNHVTMLDFATGTGTFLLEAFRQILEKTDKGMRDRLIGAHLLKNFYGFEYLIAPYTVAHLKLSQYLKNENYQMKNHERLQIYLTNSLENKEGQGNLLLPALTKESETAFDIKTQQSILVITGNPPYNVKSQNNSKWITKLIETYKHLDGKKLNEANSKVLQDDYVKFIRFAQYKMQDIERGIIAIITSHSFLDNPTFRGMRKSLMQDFDKIYLLDLHGNSRKKEVSPDGSPDVNIFDIQQGVAISILIKDKNIKDKGIFHADFYGARQSKYNNLFKGNLKKIKKKLKPVAPFYLFTPQDNQNLKPYYQNWAVNDIFPIHSTGVKTHRDHFAIAFDKNILKQRITDFCNLEITDDEIVNKYDLKNTNHFETSSARKKLAKDNQFQQAFTQLLYRPFDERAYFHHKELVERMRNDVMHHMLVDDNLGLVTVRQRKAGDNWFHTFIANQISDSTYISNETSETSYLFPLYLYPPAKGEKIPKDIRDAFGDDNPFANVKKIENLAPEFRKFIDGLYGKSYPPEQILGYIYAVLYSNSYRTKYLQFLKSDFPRIPFTENASIFEKLAIIGNDLMGAHLLKKLPDSPKITYPIGGNHLVEKLHYHADKQRLYINKTQYFTNIAADIYDFHIGGYQVLDKYLKARKGRELNLDEIENIKNIVKSLSFTLSKMQEIDKIWQA